MLVALLNVHDVTTFEGVAILFAADLAQAVLNQLAYEALPTLRYYLLVLLAELLDNCILTSDRHVVTRVARLKRPKAFRSCAWV